MTYKIYTSDGATLGHPNHKDLVSNLTIFNEQYTSTELSEIENFNDDSDYSNYQTLEEVLESYDPSSYDGKSFTVRVNEKYIFSSCDLQGGYDRPSALRNPSNDGKCRSNLRKPFNGVPRGFRDEDCNVLNGWIRVEETPTKTLSDAILGDKQYTFTLVKNMGNHRFWMKKLANKGKRVEILMKIRFHQPSVLGHDKVQWIKIESDGHHQDADARASQNEGQKFISGYRGETKEIVHCFNFLKKMQLEYKPNPVSKGIMTLEGYNVDGDWIKITSIQGLKDGEGNGLFKKYGTENIKYAIYSLKEVCKITGEDSFSYTALSVFALMYQSLTEDHSTPDSSSKVLFDKMELHRFFMTYYKVANNEEDAFGGELAKYAKLSELTQTQTMKSPVLLASDAYWPKIQGWYKKNVNKGQGINAFSYQHPNMRFFISKADRLFQKDILSKVA